MFSPKICILGIQPSPETASCSQAYTKGMTSVGCSHCGETDGGRFHSLKHPHAVLVPGRAVGIIPDGTGVLTAAYCSSSSICAGICNNMGLSFIATKKSCIWECGAVPGCQQGGNWRRNNGKAVSSEATLCRQPEKYRSRLALAGVSYRILICTSWETEKLEVCIRKFLRLREWFLYTGWTLFSRKEVERGANSLENTQLWLDLLLPFGKPEKATGFECFVSFPEESKFVVIVVTVSLPSLQ